MNEQCKWTATTASKDSPCTCHGGGDGASRVGQKCIGRCAYESPINALLPYRPMEHSTIVNWAMGLKLGWKWSWASDDNVYILPKGREVKLWAKTRELKTVGQSRHDFLGKLEPGLQSLLGWTSLSNPIINPPLLFQRVCNVVKDTFSQSS